MKMQGSSSPRPQTIENIQHWPGILAGASASAEKNWGRGIEGLRARELSLLLHTLAAVLLLFPIFHGMAKQHADGKGGLVDNKIFFPKGGGGGGGARQKEPALKGEIPQFSWLQKTPPAPILNSHPILPADATLLGPPEIIVPPTEFFGDPLSKFMNHSRGPGGGNGNGSGCCGGSGPGEGRGAGPGKDWGTGGRDPKIPGRNGVGFPECVYCPTPSFSEEARKSKLQGAVTLNIVVGADGRVTYIHVSRGLGMGLDERAVEAVRGWRFKPALGPDRKPVPTEVQIEVTFRLL